MERRKLGFRKKAAIATAVIVAVTTLLGGTFAWSSISQSALNEAKASGNNPGGRLHDDFNGVNKDVYIENFGTMQIFARVKLLEYMETGDGAGLKSGDTGYGDKNVTVFKPGADINDWQTWSVHKPAPSIDNCGLDTNGKFHDYWAWTMGGSKIYMPTFNKNKDSFKTDYSGSENWGISSAGYNHNVSDPEHGADADGVGGFLTGMPGSHSQWTAGQTKTDTAYYRDKNQTETHTAKSTLSGSVVTMQQWKDLGSPTGAYWVIDTDGWAYWAQAIEPDTATGLLLNEINLKVEMEEDWYYAIFANAELVSRSDIDMIYDGGDVTDDGKDLIESAWQGGQIVGGNGQQYVNLGTTSHQVSYSGHTGEVAWSISPAVTGVSVNQSGIVTVAETVPLGTTFTVRVQSASNPSNFAEVSLEAVLPVNAQFFPDAPFKSYIDGLSAGRHYFTKAQAEAVTEISISNSDSWNDSDKFASIKGIEYFTELKTLSLRFQKLTAVDLSKNLKLEYLNLSDNKLTAVDVTMLTNLVNLSFFNNQLTEIDVSTLNILDSLDVTGNKLTEIDVSMLTTHLRYLSIASNQLTEIDVTKNARLDGLMAGSNNLTEVDVTQNPLLNQLHISQNPLTGINVTKNPLLNYLTATKCGLTTVDLSKNPALNRLHLDENNLSTLDISKTSLTSLQDFSINKNNMTSLVIGTHQSIYKTAPNTAPVIAGSPNTNQILTGNRLGNGTTLQYYAPFGTTFTGITYAP